MVRCGGVRRLIVAGILVMAPAYIGFAFAQAPAGRGAAPAGRGAAPASATVQPRVYANMVQLMRGTLYPQSNVIFTAQVEDPASFKPATHQSTSSDPFTSAYGGWEAVENSGLAMAETANLLLVPRQCSNGKPAPIQNADWQMWVQELRDAAVGASTRPARRRMTTSCSRLPTSWRRPACTATRAYRNVPGGVPNRC